MTDLDWPRLYFLNCTITSSCRTSCLIHDLNHDSAGYWNFPTGPAVQAGVDLRLSTLRQCIEHELIEVYSDHWLHDDKVRTEGAIAANDPRLEDEVFLRHSRAVATQKGHTLWETEFQPDWQRYWRMDCVYQHNSANTLTFYVEYASNNILEDLLKWLPELLKLNTQYGLKKEGCHVYFRSQVTNWKILSQVKVITWKGKIDDPLFVNQLLSRTETEIGSESPHLLTRFQSGELIADRSQQQALQVLSRLSRKWNYSDLPTSEKSTPISCYCNEDDQYELDSILLTEQYHTSTINKTEVDCIDWVRLWLLNCIVAMRDRTSFLTHEIHRHSWGTWKFPEGPAFQVNPKTRISKLRHCIEEGLISVYPDSWLEDSRFLNADTIPADDPRLDDEEFLKHTEAIVTSRGHALWESEFQPDWNRFWKLTNKQTDEESGERLHTVVYTSNAIRDELLYWLPRENRLATQTELITESCHTCFRYQATKWKVIPQVKVITWRSSPNFSELDRLKKLCLGTNDETEKEKIRNAVADLFKKKEQSHDRGLNQLYLLSSKWDCDSDSMPVLIHRTID
ncbi:hypothetical protein HG66A1_15140 [Gimesia chilikensis]|uniref:Uncharacterized protein n=2 Tax=Gimesia chilikensis TaxID=2605989 RepID=A0A517PK43_9PLAN|nr:hypothetical protein HG66A1_15140 [Gimesia chilikensis]